MADKPYLLITVFTAVKLFLLASIYLFIMLIGFFMLIGGFIALITPPNASMQWQLLSLEVGGSVILLIVHYLDWRKKIELNWHNFNRKRDKYREKYK